MSACRDRMWDRTV